MPNTFKINKRLSSFKNDTLIIQSNIMDFPSPSEGIIFFKQIYKFLFVNSEGEIEVPDIKEANIQIGNR